MDEDGSGLLVREGGSCSSRLLVDFAGSSWSVSAVRLDEALVNPFILIE